jgi:hypothetical protein
MFVCCWYHKSRQILPTFHLTLVFVSLKYTPRTVYLVCDNNCVLYTSIKSAYSFDLWHIETIGQTLGQSFFEVLALLVCWAA